MHYISPVKFKIPIKASHKFRATITILIVTFPEELFSFTSRAMFLSLVCKAKMYIDVWIENAWFRLHWFICNRTVSITYLNKSDQMWCMFLKYCLSTMFSNHFIECRIWMIVVQLLFVYSICESLYECRQFMNNGFKWT